MLEVATMSKLGTCPCGCDDCYEPEVDATAIRDWADKQKALGLIRTEEYDTLFRCADDLEVS